MRCWYFFLSFSAACTGSSPSFRANGIRRSVVPKYGMYMVLRVTARRPSAGKYILYDCGRRRSNRKSLSDVSALQSLYGLM